MVGLMSAGTTPRGTFTTAPDGSRLCLLYSETALHPLRPCSCRTASKGIWGRSDANNQYSVNVRYIILHCITFDRLTVGAAYSENQAPYDISPVLSCTVHL